MGITVGSGIGGPLPAPQAVSVPLAQPGFVAPGSAIGVAPAQPGLGQQPATVAELTNIIAMLTAAGAGASVVGGGAAPIIGAGLLGPATNNLSSITIGGTSNLIMPVTMPDVLGGGAAALGASLTIGGTSVITSGMGLQFPGVSVLGGGAGQMLTVGGTPVSIGIGSGGIDPFVASLFNGTTGGGPTGTTVSLVAGTDPAPLGISVAAGTQPVAAVGTTPIGAPAVAGAPIAGGGGLQGTVASTLAALPAGATNDPTIASYVNLIQTLSRTLGVA